MTTTPNDPFSSEPGNGGTDSSGTAEGGAGSSGGTGPTAAPGAQFFDAVRRSGIVRPDSGRMLAGVAAGIGRRYGIDPLLVRIAFAALTVLGGLGVTLYGLGWLLLPHPDGRIHAQQVLTGTVTAGFVGAAGALLLMAHHLVPMLLVALVVYLVLRNHRGHRQTTA